MAVLRSIFLLRDTYLILRTLIGNFKRTTPAAISFSLLWGICLKIHLNRRRILAKSYEQDFIYVTFYCIILRIFGGGGGGG